MVSLLIVLVLCIGAYAGYQRGIIRQLIQTIGYAIVFLAAMVYYKPFSDFVYLLIPYSTPFAPESNPYPFYEEQFMFSMDYAYYDLFSFLILLVVGWGIVRFLAGLLSYTLDHFRAPEPLSGIGGAVLGLFVNYIGVFYILFFLTTLPFDFIQSRLLDSSFATRIIAQTPVLSQNAYQRFIVDVHKEASQEKPAIEILPPAEPNEELTGENSE